MPTIRVRRYNSQTGKPISTKVKVGKLVLSGQTAPFPDKTNESADATIQVPYLTYPNGNLYAIEIYNPRGYSFDRIEGNTTFIKGGSIWYKFPITSNNGYIDIKLYFNPSRPSYLVGGFSDISSGRGIVGPLGPEGQGLRWSGNSVKDRISVERGKYVGIEVFNVENYAI